MLKFFYSLATLLFLSSVATANIIYSIENHAATQDGHSLSGTIVTTSAAPTDGVLMAAEIVSWNFSVTGPSSFSASSTDVGASINLVGTVNITPT